MSLIKANNKRHVLFGITNNITNSDIGGQPAKPHPAPLAAHRFNHTFLRLVMHDLHQVIAGNIICTGNFFNCDQPILMQSRIDQDTQGIVGEMGKAHRKLDQGHQRCLWLDT